MKRRKLEQPALPVMPWYRPWDRDRYGLGWLTVERDEEQVVQPAVLARLRAHNVFAAILDSGARTLRGRAFGALRRAGAGKAAMARVMRGNAGAADGGTPDTIGCWRDANGVMVAIECKKPEVLVLRPDSSYVQVKPAGQPTREQLLWLHAAWQHGAIVGVAWGPTDVDGILARGLEALGEEGR